MKRFLSAICGLTAFGTLGAAGYAQTTKIACIGNSITAQGYPDRLGKLLGAAYQVQNDGVSGNTLLKKGDHPYWVEGKLPAVFALKPNIITIKLGTNDSKPQNWVFKADFAKDLQALVDTLGRISPKPVIWLCLPVPAWPINGANSYGIDGAIIENQIIPIIKAVADSNKLKTIDLHTPMLGMKAHFPDGVHPDSVGQDSLAHLVLRALLAKPTVVAAMSKRALPEMDLRGRVLRIALPEGGGNYQARLFAMDGTETDHWSGQAGHDGPHGLEALRPGAYLLTVRSDFGLAAKRLELGAVGVRQ